MNAYTITHFAPFDPVHKRTEAAVTAADGTTFRVTKGAPQVILALAANAAQITSAADNAVNDFAARGFRSLGVARADGDGDWQFVGVLPLFDPPREDAAATIATARAMGVTVKMVTGDALAIAKETATKVGLGTHILDAAALGDSKKSETAAVAESIETADGFAQVFPEHKYHIIDVLQQRGHIVGMTGDGVNDAPALKKADCGIAVSGATDAARAAADIVLLDPGPVSDHRSDQAEPQDLPADEQLRDLPHRRNAAGAAVHDRRHPGLQLLPTDRDHDRDARAAQRRCHPVHRLRQRALPQRTRSLEHARWYSGSPPCWGSSGRSPRSACSTWATGSSTSATRACRH